MIHQYVKLLSYNYNIENNQCDDSISCICVTCTYLIVTCSTLHTFWMFIDVRQNNSAHINVIYTHMYNMSVRSLLLRTSSVAKIGVATDLFLRKFQML